MSLPEALMSLPPLRATRFGFCQRLLPPPPIFQKPDSRRPPACVRHCGPWFWSRIRNVLAIDFILTEPGNPISFVFVGKNSGEQSLY